MKLTEKKALKLSIEMWAWLNKHPLSTKFEWPKYKRYETDCFMCSYCVDADKNWTCKSCCLKSKSLCCGGWGKAYAQWDDATTEIRSQKGSLKILNALKKRLTKLEDPK